LWHFRNVCKQKQNYFREVDALFSPSDDEKMIAKCSVKPHNRLKNVIIILPFLLAPQFDGPLDSIDDQKIEISFELRTSKKFCKVKTGTECNILNSFFDYSIAGF
jgi:hypothetical protein